MSLTDKMIHNAQCAWAAGRLGLRTSEVASIAFAQENGIYAGCDTCGHGADDPSFAGASSKRTPQRSSASAWKCCCGSLDKSGKQQLE